MEIRKIKILAIDDNQDNLTILKALIKDIFPDILTLTALNGKKGLELAASEDPDVILLDVIMPEMDGFEVCRKLKSDKKLRDIPVVFITSLKGDRETRICALECGADAFLSKPVEETELTAQIRAMIKIKNANMEKRGEEERLKSLVGLRTLELMESHTAALNLLEDLTKENKIRKESEKILGESEAHYRSLVEGVPGIVYSYSNKRGGVYYSPQVKNILGYSPEQLYAQPMLWQNSIHPDDLLRIKQVLQETTGGKPFCIEYRIRDTLDNWHWFEDRSLSYKMDDDDVIIEGFALDITERKLAERRQFLSAEILGILNNTLSLPDMINGVLSAIKKETGFDAVGIRLKNGDDFPYFSQNGFSSDFLLTENTLIVHDKDGGVCKNEDGSISLECTCGLVISGKIDPANPLFTSGGSFWTNNSVPLLKLSADQDPRLHPRNICIHEGFNSVALFPIRANQEIVGLIQLNNRKKDSMTADMIPFFEGIGVSIGVALLQKQAEVALQASEKELRELAESMPQIVWITRPDGWNIYFNQQWVDYTGLTLKESYGHGWNTPFHPDDRQRARDAWENATQNDTTYSIESRLRRADGVYRWWLVRGLPIRDANGKILKWFGTCTDIEDIKHAEKELRQKAEELLASNHELELFNRAMVGRELRMIDLKQEINELCRRLSEPPRHEMDQLQANSVPSAGQVPVPQGGGGV